MEAETSLLLALAVEVGGIGIFDTDLERKRTQFSGKLCTILGFPVGTELPYAKTWKLIDPRDRKTIKTRIRAAHSALEKGKWSGVCRVSHAEGGVRWVSICGRQFYRETANGLVAVRSIGTIVDVTELREVDAALHESERRLRLALDAAEMGTFEADFAAGTARIDKQEAHILGLPEDERTVSVADLRKRIPLDDLDASDAKQVRMTDLREAYRHEFRLRMPDGSNRWLRAHADVRSGRIFGVSFDVTQSKLAETALRDSEARLRIATEGADLGVFEWHPVEDRATWVNDQMYRIFGRTGAEGPLNKQQFVADYLIPPDILEFESAVARAMRTGKLHVVCRIRRKNGTRRWLQIDGKMQQASADTPKRLIGVVADITKRKRLEDAWKRQSQRLLDVQEEERRNIAHELHDSTVQHLVGASLLLAILRDGKQDQSLWDDLEQTLQEAMNELRTFSYLMQPPTLNAFGLAESLQRLVNGFSVRSGLRIKLRACPTHDVRSLVIQRSILRIVQEALSNAYRHASASVVSVHLRRIGRRLHIIITDNGVGISTEYLSGPPRRPARSGVGILGIEMRLKRYGGRMKLSRPPAGGTRLHVVLPIDARVP